MMTTYRQALEDAARVCNEILERTRGEKDYENNLYLKGILHGAVKCEHAILALPEPAQPEPVAEAVQRIIDRSSHCMVTDGAGAVHSAVKAKISDLLALAPPALPESVGEIMDVGDDTGTTIAVWGPARYTLTDGTKLYAGPPAQSAPSLTDEEIMDQWAKSAAQSETWRGQVLRFARSLLEGGK